MEPAGVDDPAPGDLTFCDGLGERRRLVDRKDGMTFDLLVIRPELAAIPSFLPALRERVSGLAEFRHADYARIRGVLRLHEGSGTVGIISEHVGGIRLSELLARSSARGVASHVNVVMGLSRQLVSAVAALHESSNDLAHGAIGPERLLITPQAHLVVADYALGPALERLRYPAERYWKELRIALPVSVGPLPHFDQRADVTQIGVVVLSLVLGRLLTEDEYPSRLREIIASAWTVSRGARSEPWPQGLRGWLGRALQLDARNPFANAVDACASLREMLDDDSSASPVDIEPILGGLEAADRAHAGAIGAGQAPATPPPTPSGSAPFGAVASVSASVPSSTAAAALARGFTHEDVWLASFDTEGMEPPQATALLERRAEVVRSTDAAVRTDTGPRPTAKDTVPSAWKAESLFSGTLESFDSEMSPSFGLDDTGFRRQDSPEMFTHVLASRSRSGVRMGAAALAILVAVGVPAGQWLLKQPVPAVRTGTLVIVTNPPGVTTVIDGMPGGTTPLKRTVNAGTHTVELHGAGSSRTIAIDVSAGGQAAQYIELPGAAINVGHLNLSTEPPGAVVTIDGVIRGATPTVADLAPGEHTVMLYSDLGWVTQTVSIESGVTASLVVPATSWSVVAP